MQHPAISVCRRQSVRPQLSIRNLCPICRSHPPPAHQFNHQTICRQHHHMFNQRTTNRRCNGGDWSWKEVRRPNTAMKKENHHMRHLRPHQVSMVVQISCRRHLYSMRKTKGSFMLSVEDEARHMALTATIGDEARHYLSTKDDALVRLKPCA